ncbi:hypothetical protein GpartN1_g4354.t1 [Galdieria partita]|uniref:Profilin n=1 Tax=Galdieria partita TaxID=83374 RepID=A0A9C7UQZ5_9RHOD|nr:hypothetical protein GpartN1_g4189.t1 [Galdieria partita]GJQ12563.1 hypothetical protein GpartN1_g4354.t1 [Galdieria partita]
MSWQVYVDQQLLGSGRVKEAAICSLDGNIWARSAGFQASTEELKKLIATFQQTQEAAQNGIFLGNKKYFFLRSTEDTVYGKWGEDGFVAMQTNMCLIVAIFTKPVSAAECATAVGRIVDYLKSAGY